MCDDGTLSVNGNTFWGGFKISQRVQENKRWDTGQQRYVITPITHASACSLFTFTCLPNKHTHTHVLQDVSSMGFFCHASMDLHLDIVI